MDVRGAGTGCGRCGRIRSRQARAEFHGAHEAPGEGGPWNSQHLVGGAGFDDLAAVDDDEVVRVDGGVFEAVAHPQERGAVLLLEPRRFGGALIGGRGPHAVVIWSRMRMPGAAMAARVGAARCNSPPGRPSCACPDHR
ncbi:hypothetical protein GCM10010266_57650 [Streptomyces griseomycini]|nr:hypothetical protein GCM10010266_57650 [Streptomyces griseomycini]GGR45924.1 hypothetical protein GCM10015536_59650 [Streptomyces griseomycini]